MAERYGVSPHALVIAWVMARGGTVIPIPAARSEKNALDSLTAATVDMTPEDVAVIDAAEFSLARD